MAAKSPWQDCPCVSSPYNAIFWKILVIFILIFALLQLYYDSVSPSLGTNAYRQASPSARDSNFLQEQWVKFRLAWIPVEENQQLDDFPDATIPETLRETKKPSSSNDKVWRDPNNHYLVQKDREIASPNTEFKSNEPTLLQKNKMSNPNAQIRSAVEKYSKVLSQNVKVERNKGDLNGNIHNFVQKDRIQRPNTKLERNKDELNGNIPALLQEDRIQSSDTKLERNKNDLKGSIPTFVQKDRIQIPNTKERHNDDDLNPTIPTFLTPSSNAVPEGSAADRNANSVTDDVEDGNYSSRPKTFSQPSNHANLRRCPLVPKGLVGAINVDTSTYDLKLLEEEHPELLPGGHWYPQECLARSKVAIIVPFRAREEQLPTFLRHIHPFLQKQQLDYTIFVVEQAGTDPFNRGKLMNIGSLESLKLYPFECYVFHDVDLLPENDRNIYTCPEQPRHLSVGMSTFHYKLLSPNMFGGAGSFTIEQFQTVNGFGNIFWGWGGEDNDMSARIRLHGYEIIRYPAEHGKYKMLSHEKAQRTADRMVSVRTGKRQYNTDGLNSIQYRVLDTQQRRLYTWVYADLLYADTANSPP